MTWIEEEMFIGGAVRPAEKTAVAVRDDDLVVLLAALEKLIETEASAS